MHFRLECINAEIFLSSFLFISYTLFITSRKGEYKEREANLGRKIMRVNTIKNGKRVKPLRKH